MNIWNKESSKWNFHQGWKVQFQLGEEEVLIHEESDPPGLWESRTTSQDKHGWNEHFRIWEHKNKSLWCVKNVDEVFKKKQAVPCGSITYFEFFFPWHSVVQATLSQSAWLQILTTTQDPVWSWTSDMTACVSISTTAKQGHKGPWGLRNGLRNLVGPWPKLSRQWLQRSKGTSGPVRRGQSAPLRAVNLTERTTECHQRPWSPEMTKCSLTSCKST